MPLSVTTRIKPQEYAADFSDERLNLNPEQASKDRRSPVGCATPAHLTDRPDGRLLFRAGRRTSVNHSVLSLFLTLWRTAKKRPGRNYRQDRLLHNRGGEIRTRDLLNPMPIPCADWR